MRMSFVCAVSLFSTVALANPAEPEGLTTTKLAEGFYLITGPGGNIALDVGKDGVFLVDDQVKPMAPNLKAEIAKVTKEAVRFVVNTHWHGDHTGGNQAMGEAGAVIVAHDNVRKRLSSEQVIAAMHKKVPPSPEKALPVITFADAVTFHLNGDELQVFHVEPAHTDTDSMVYWKKRDILHMGDVYFSSGYPFIDTSTGGHAEGYITAADRVLQLIGDKTRIIGGHGPVGDKKKLKAYRDMLATIRDRVKKAVADGKSLAEVQAQRPTSEFDAQWGAGFINAKEIVDTFYKDLGGKKF